MPRRWLQGSAQGFNPGNPQNNEFALKGREAEQINLAPMAAQKLECAIETCYNLDPTFALLVRSICRPFRARRSGWRFPGLKPWAESSCPFGAEISRRDFLQMSKLQTIVALRAWLLSCRPSGTKTIGPSKRLALSWPLMG